MTMHDDECFLVVGFTDSTIELVLVSTDKELQRMVLNIEQAKFLKDCLSSNKHLISTKDGE